MGIQYNPSIITQNLVLCLDAANSKSYPGSGTAWTDLSGRGNTGTLTNGPTYSTANGGSIVFDGTNDYTQLTSQNLRSVDFSVEVWFYATKAVSSTQILYTSYNLPGGAQANTLIFSIGASKVSASTGGAQVATSATTISTNTWYHAVVTYTASSTTIRLYLNGNFEASTVASISSGASSNYIGGSPGDNNIGSLWFGGSIPILRAYRNKALSAAEILQNFNALAPRYFDAGAGPGSISFPFSSPVQAQSFGISAGTYYFKSGAMSTAQLLEYQPNYYESRPFCCVFRSAYVSTATTNKIDLSIPMAGLLVQRDTLDLRGAVYWSTPITYTTVGGTGNNTADSGTGYAGSNARRVILGNAGGHGLYNTGQSSCNWPSAAGAIGAGWDGVNCGTFPDGLKWGTGSGGSPVYDNRSGTWSHWVTWS